MHADLLIAPVRLVGAEILFASWCENQSQWQGALNRLDF